MPETADGVTLILQRDVPKQAVQGKEKASNHKCSVVSQSLLQSMNFAQMQKYSVPHSTLKMSVGGAEAIEEDCEMKGIEKVRMKPWRLRRKHICIGGSLEVLSSARREMIILLFL